MLEKNQVYLGDSKDVLKKIEDNTVDLILTDPPYGINFMNKGWDRVLPDKNIWRESFRVLKAGAWLLVMSAPRSDVYSRMIVAIEEAGFDVSFTPIVWAYSSGFPKASNIKKMIDKRIKLKANEKFEGSFGGYQPKPAVEMIIVAMKPLSEKTFVDQALKNGKGITWLDKGRIPYSNEADKQQAIVGFDNENEKSQTYELGHKQIQQGEINDKGRFPANLIVSDKAVDTGKLRQGGFFPAKRGESEFFGLDEKESNTKIGAVEDSGDFSRYFDLDVWYRTYRTQFAIFPKPAGKEKNKGLNELPIKQTIGGGGTNNKRCGSAYGSIKAPAHNYHPTVKGVKLMSYLIEMFSRAGDLVVDPFCGSGTTGVSAIETRREFIGIEISPDYHVIAQARLVEELEIKKYMLF